MKVLGIDEAGRGPVIGPMVMCGALVDSRRQEELRTLGVRDSKVLSAARRQELLPQVSTVLLDSHCEVIGHQEIDACIAKGINLNSIEARTSAKIINLLKPDEVILDCPSTNINDYVRQIRAHVDNPRAKIIAEFKADEHFPVVSAASIIAKVRRDACIEQLKEQHGVDFGSGYLSDPKTEAFLQQHFADVPVFRTSWAPWRKLQVARQQYTLAGNAQTAAGEDAMLLKGKGSKEGASQIADDPREQSQHKSPGQQRTLQ